jgi:predicted DNA-binding helix-hairpin-helix protein
MSVPGIGAKGADTILELREAKGDLELDDLNQVPCFCLLLLKIDVKQTFFLFIGDTGLTTYL